MKECLLRGAIPDNDPRLEVDLTAPGSHLNRSSDQLVIESKENMQKRGVAPADGADALAFTFAAHVAPIEPEPGREQWRGMSRGSWMG